MLFFVNPSTHRMTQSPPISTKTEVIFISSMHKDKVTLYKDEMKLCNSTLLN